LIKTVLDIAHICALEIGLQLKESMCNEGRR